MKKSWSSEIKSHKSWTCDTGNFGIFKIKKVICPHITTATTTKRRTALATAVTTSTTAAEASTTTRWLGKWERLVRSANSSGCYACAPSPVTGTGKAGWAGELRPKRLWPLLSLWQFGAGELGRGRGPRAEDRRHRLGKRAWERLSILRQYLQERKTKQLPLLYGVC